MIILKLIHPEHGVCAFQGIYGNFTEHSIKESWRKRYGVSNYNKCTVTQEQTGKSEVIKQPSFKQNGAIGVAPRNIKQSRKTRSD